MAYALRNTAARKRENIDASVETDMRGDAAPVELPDPDPPPAEGEPEALDPD